MVPIPDPHGTTNPMAWVPVYTGTWALLVDFLWQKQTKTHLNHLKKSDMVIRKCDN